MVRGLIAGDSGRAFDFLQAAEAALHDAAARSGVNARDDNRTWLNYHSDQLLAAYGKLGFLLPAGMIHGDAWRGNLLRDAHRVVLADWDNVSVGPREIDLVPTLQAPRFGLPEDQRDAFIDAYGRDIRSWDGYQVLLRTRELSTVSALLREAHASDAARRELLVRLGSIRAGDDGQWTSF